MTRALVVGLAVTGEAVARRLRAEGWDVVIVEDAPGSGADYATRVARVAAAGARVVEAPDADALAALVAGVDLVVPSPLVAPVHPAIARAAATGIPVRSEVDLAAERARAPIVAVTGTNGKTTVTTLVAAILRAAGRRVVEAGNIGRPLIDVVDTATDVLAVEVSSFQLCFAGSFRPRVAVLLAVAEDHLDWHGSVAHYAASKRRIFEHQRADDLLVFDADDPVASSLAGAAPARRVGVSRQPGADGCFRATEHVLVDPAGDVIVPRAEMRRALPHDCTNALAAAAAALAIGAGRAAARAALAAHATLPHRVALVGEHGGVRYYDDSKATNPHATLHALASFDSAVLLAGGRNKGLDLGVLARAADRVRAVVAFGEAASEVEVAFAGVRPTVRASSMAGAVRAAAALAMPGDVVLLSPGCASFDAYAGYAQRGDDFAAHVLSLIDREGVESR